MDGFWAGFGMSGEEIYRNFTEAPGAGELAAAADIVRMVQAEHEDEAASVRALAVRMESAWQGDAAGAAQRGAVPLAAEHEWGAPLFFTAQDLTSRQVGSFDDARHGVVPVPPAPDRPSGWAIITSPTTLPTYERQLSEHNAAAQHNVDMMTGYEGASSFNGDNLPTSYGSISPDSAGIAVRPPAAGPDAGQRVDGPSSPQPAGPPGGPGGVEWQPTGGSGGGPDPTASPSGGQGGQQPQGTTPGGYVPPKPPPGPGAGVPGTGVPSGSGGGGELVGVPPVGRPPGGPGSGTRGPAGGPGGGGRPGAGPGGEAGPGGRSGVGPPAGGVAAEAAARGGSGARAGGAGGVPLGMGPGRGRGGEDEERERPSWLIQPEDPEVTFGTDERTAPPVIGDEAEEQES